MERYATGNLVSPNLIENYCADEFDDLIESNFLINIFETFMPDIRAAHL